jgi:hypothetical protein
VSRGSEPVLEKINLRVTGWSTSLKNNFHLPHFLDSFVQPFDFATSREIKTLILNLSILILVPVMWI